MIDAKDILLQNETSQWLNLDINKNNIHSSFLSYPMSSQTGFSQNLDNDNENYNDYLNYINLQTNSLNYFDQENICQTPSMSLKTEETQTIQNIKPYNLESITSNTNDSSKIIQIDISPKIENLVSTANLGCQLNLREIAMQAKNAEYNPKRFSAVIMKIKEPKTTALIFSTGKIVCLGAKSEFESKKSCRKFAKIIKSLGYPVVFKDFKIQNVVGSADARFQISLTKLYIHFVKNINFKGKSFIAYEPEQFPGLIYRMVEPNIVIIIFFSGKLVLTGGKGIDDIYQGFKKIYPLLVKFKNEVGIKNNKMIHLENIKEIKEYKKGNN